MRAARRPGKRPRELFLSHSSRNAGFARRLVATIRKHGVKVWYSETAIQGAQQWHDEIGRALKRCDWFAVVLSPASVRARWVKQELLYALNDRRYESRIVPILYEPCKPAGLSWTLAQFQQIDFSGRYPDGCAALLGSWGIEYRP